MAAAFSGKSVFITGASAGIGAALALEFAGQGARVALAARRKDKLEALAGGIRGDGGQALALRCDVTDRSQVDAAIAETVEAFGGLDVAVANAGFGVSGEFLALGTGDFRRQFDTNVFGLIDTAYAAAPHLAASRGRLVFISSVFGKFSAPTSAAYCASKFAVCGLAEALYYELADTGVSVTCINPGIVASQFRMVDNEGLYHADRSDPAPPLLVMPAKKAARQIVRAIGKRRFDVVITRHGKLAVFLNRHFPRSFRFVFRTLTKGRTERFEKAKRG